MSEQLETDLEIAIRSNAKASAKEGVRADDAMKYTQAALNAAQALGCFKANSK